MNIEQLTSRPHNFTQIRIENTNRCGYSCVFCPREKMDRPQNVMSVDDFKLVMGRVEEHHPGYRQDFHLHGYGEPLLDRTLPEKIAITKAIFPKTKSFIITTLGVNVGEEYIRTLIHSGLDTMRVSFYSSSPEQYKTVTRTSMFDVAVKNLITVGKIARANPNLRVMITGDILGIDDIDGKDNGPKPLIEILAEEYGFTITKGTVHNFGSGRNYNQADEGGVCSVFNGVRHSILQITWDLDVIPCCFDYNASMKLGNLRTQNIAEIFNGRPYRDLAIAQMENALSSYDACANCDRRYDPADIRQ